MKHSFRYIFNDCVGLKCWIEMNFRDLANNSKTLSVENIQSLNAAYSNNFERSPRDSTLGRVSLLSSSAHGTSPQRKKNIYSFMQSSPNLSVMASASSTSQSILNKKHTDHRHTSGTSLFPVNGDDPSLRNSGGDNILQLQQEIEALRRDLDLKETKLQTNMNSIKTFWSPELKKERALRKEDSVRINTLQDQLKVAREEIQHAQLTMQALQDELRAQRDLNQLLQDDFTSSHRHGGDAGFSVSSGNTDSRLVEESNERLLRENELLKQTMEEMEARIEAQQETLDTRDESVRKLLDILQCKGLTKTDDAGISVEIDALRVQVADYESRLASMELLLQEKNKELLNYKQKLQGNNDVFEDNAGVKALQTLLDVKETKVASLERIIHDLEDELTSARHEEALASAERKEETRQLEAYRSHSNLMKEKIEQYKSDLQKKDKDLLSLQTRLDTLSNQQSDSRQHIDVLKESLLTKEQGSALLQSEVESLRARIEEKQLLLDQKQDQLSRFQEEKSSGDAELLHLRDTMDVKDRKITVLMKKIDSLKEAMTERDRELEIAKTQLRSLQQDSSSFDCNMSTMEEALEKKNEELKMVKSEKAIIEEKLQNDVDELRKMKRSLEKELDALQSELGDREIRLNEVQEKASSLASSDLKKDSKIKQLEISLEERLEEVTRLDSQLRKEQNSTALAITKEENKERVEELEKAVQDKTDEAEKCQKDLDRLLEILKETENEKHSKDKKITSLEKEVKELHVKIKSLNDQMVQELKRKGAAQDKDIANYLEQVRKSRDRVEELEVALKESLNITAEREEVLSREEERRHKVERRLDEFVAQFDKTKAILDETRKRLASGEESLLEKNRRIDALKKENRKLLEEALEMRQDALLAAISEKDANIALLELSRSRQKPNNEQVSMLRREKDRLVQQLKQQTQNRLRLIHDGDDLTPSNDQFGEGNSSRPSRPQGANDAKEGVWA